MSADKTGGPAFPVPALEYTHPSGQRLVADHPGMTLRDYFAAEAMKAFLMLKDGAYRTCTAEAAYKMADDMIAEREKS